MSERSQGTALSHFKDLDAMIAERNSLLDQLEPAPIINIMRYARQNMIV